MSFAYIRGMEFDGAELMRITARGFLYALVFLIALRSLLKRLPRLARNYRHRSGADTGPQWLQDALVSVLAAFIAAVLGGIIFFL